jgi:vitamin B12 transporter
MRLGWAALLMVPGALTAQRPTSQAKDTITLQPIVVTATKLPIPVSATGAAVTVITGKDLRDRGLRRVVDALRTVPGVAIAQLGGTGAVASVFMRGGESDYVQVLVDGVQVNDPGGSYDWAHLTTDDVDRIEVVRGPVSVLYGSDAVAGVVQIFTRNGTARTDASAQIIGGRGERVGAGASGSYSASDMNASLSGSRPLSRGLTLSGSASASRLNSDGGYAFNNDYDNTTLSGKLDVARGDRAHAGISVRSVEQTFHYPTSGSGAIVDRNQLNDGTSLALGLNGGIRLTPVFETVAQLSSYRSRTGGRNPEDNPGDGFANSSADVRRMSGELRLNSYLARSTVATVGVEAEHEKGSTTFDSDGPFGPFNSATNDERTNRGYFAQLLSTPVSRVTFSGGVRVDDNEAFGSFTTGRASATVRVTELLSLRGAIGSGFKEPTFLENYATGFAVGNPDLQPEHSRSGEVGVEINAHRAQLGGTLFDQRYRDLIQFTFNTPSVESPNYFNIGAARARGVELTAAAVATGRVRLNAEYTYVDSEVEDAGFGEDMAFVDGARLLRRPTHHASVTATAQATNALTTTLSVIYTGNRDDLDFTDPGNFAGSRVVLPAHTTVDGSASYRLPVRAAAASLLLRVSNLLDERYDEVFNFPAARRLVWLGASIGTR